MRRTAFSVALAALLGLALAASGGSAVAGPAPDHATVKDKVGDAPAGIDLVSASYRVSHKQAQWSVKVKSLTDTTFIAFEIWPLAEGWDRIAVYREAGRTVGKVYFIDNGAESSPDPVPSVRRCPGLEVSWSFSRDVVSATVPFSCLQASSSGGASPFQFHTFSRFGGVKNSAGDSMPAKKLDF